MKLIKSSESEKLTGLEADMEIPGVLRTTVRCPMCGGFINLRINHVCYYCGSTYTEGSE